MVIKDNEGRTAEMSSSIGECHRSDAVLILPYDMSDEPAIFIKLEAYRVNKGNAGKVYVVL